MANFYGTQRTNYFKVKDMSAFEAFANKYDAAIESDGRDGVMLHPKNSDDGYFKSYDHDNDEFMDFTADLAEHLQPGHVAVIVSAGAEKLRYISGCAVAVDCAGQAVSIDLNDIYKLAETTWPGSIISRAEY